MPPFSEQWGDPCREIQTLDMDSGYDDIITWLQLHSLIPFENVLSSRATSPSI